MEAKEFDDLIRSKLNSGDNDLHAHEVERSKPYVWTAIQKQLAPTVVVMKWYYLVAAVLLILFGVSFIFTHQQNQHLMQLEKISKQMEEMKEGYNNQAVLTGIKEKELKELKLELKEMKSNILPIDNQVITKIKPQFVYRTDTVYIKEIEYVTEVLPTKTSHETVEMIEEIKEKEKGLTEVNLEDTNIAIFPSYKTSNQNKNKGNENELKFKLSAFAN